MAIDNDTYELIVVFTRSHSDDSEVCEATNRTPNEQLAVELQDACNNGYVAGSFQVWRQ